MLKAPSGKIVALKSNTLQTKFILRIPNYLSLMKMRNNFSILNEKRKKEYSLFYMDSKSLKYDRIKKDYNNFKTVCLVTLIINVSAHKGIPNLVHIL